jgi:Protein of unknown function (DUF4232)
MKRIVLVAWAAAAVLLPAGGRVPRAVGADAARFSQTAPRCSNIQLTIRSVQSQGAAGYIGVIYRLHNMWNQPCTLFGYPGLLLLDRNFHSLPTHLHRGAGSLIGGFPARLVRVGPYGNAYFALGYSDVQVGNQPCRKGFYLMIIPPNDFLPVVTYATTPGRAILACSGNIDISPVTARPRFR